MFLERRESDGLTKGGRDGDFRNVFCDSNGHIERLYL